MAIGYMTLQHILQMTAIHHVIDHNGKYLDANIDRFNTLYCRRYIISNILKVLHL